MLSRISKMSAFIVMTLILPFGLMTIDAEAQTFSPVDLTVSKNGTITVTDGVVTNITAGTDIQSTNEQLRAAEDLENLVFEITFGTDARRDADPSGKVEISIPYPWADPDNDDGDGTDEAGEVVSYTANAAVKLEVLGRVLTATVAKTDPLTSDLGSAFFAYKKVKVPVKSNRYGFKVQSTVHGDDRNLNPTVEGIVGTDYIVDVGPARSASVTVALSNSGGDGPIHRQPAQNDDNTVWEPEDFIVASKQKFGALIFTFTLVGTMEKDSLFEVEASTTWPAPAFHSTRVSVTGGTLDTATSTATQVVAKLDGRKEAGHKVEITVTGLEAPEVTPTTAINSDRVFNTDVTSALRAASGLFIAFAADTEADDTFIATFQTTSAHNSGKVALSEVTTPASASQKFNSLVLTVTELNGKAPGSIVEIDIPAGFMPRPYSGFSGDVGPGTVSLTGGEGLVVTSDKLSAKTGDTPTDPMVFTIRGGTDTTALTDDDIIAPADEGEYKFTSRSHSGPHKTTLEDINIDGAVVQVIVGNGTGTIALTRDNTPLTEATAEETIPRLVFTYTAAGRMVSGAQVMINLPTTTAGAPVNWPSTFRADDKDGRYTEGEFVVSDNVGAAIASGARAVTLTTNKVLVKNDQITLTYHNVKVPKEKGSYEFATYMASQGGVDPLNVFANKVKPSPIVGVGQPPDGSGETELATAIVADAGGPIENLVFKYTAKGSVEIGGEVRITLPSEVWPEPKIDDQNGADDAGEVTHDGVGLTTLSFTRTTITARLESPMADGESFTITYKVITAPATGDYDFVVESKVTSLGDFKPVSGSPILVRIRAIDPGAVTLSPDDSVEPLDEIGDLEFTYEAKADLDAGAVIQINIPAGWTEPFPAIDDTDDRRGAVLISANADLTFGRDPLRLIGTTNQALVGGVDTVVFTYMSIQAPETQNTYPFDATFSRTAQDTPEDIPSPEIVVRTKPTMLTLTRSANEFFVNRSIMVTVASDARAPVNGLVVTLSTEPADSGTFSMMEGGDALPDNMVTIRDLPDSMSVDVHYTSDTAGPVMLKASAMVGEGEDAVEISAEPVMVNVKSTIRNLLVNDHDVSMEEPVPPVPGDARITVSAIGEKGVGTVKVTKTEPADAEGNENIRVLVSLSLDSAPVDPTAPDGDYTYTREGGIPLGVDAADAVEGVHNSEGALLDGDYTVEVNIAGEQKLVPITVLSDQNPPTLSDASATPVGDATAKDGGEVVLSVTVTPNESMVPIASVEADVSELDSARVDDPIVLEDADEDGTYTKIFIISESNERDDGEVMVSFTATDIYDNSSEPLTAPITLRNDYEAPVLSDENAMPSPAADGMDITISVSSESGLTVTADATSIGGGMVTLTEGTADDDSADANGNGADANGNGNGMSDAAMPAGNGMYSGTATVTDAEDGEQMITITGTDGSGNVSEPVTVTVTIDNTPPMLSGESVDPPTAKSGEEVTISVNADESGLTITASGSVIDGGMVTLTEDTADDDSTDANGNGNDNGADTNGNGNGADTNGNGGNGMMYSYSGTAMIADDAEAGDYEITISTMDALENPSEVTVNVEVEVEVILPTISNLQVNGMDEDELESVEPGATITVTVLGKAGGGTLSVTDDAGDPVESLTGLGLNLDTDAADVPEGSVAYMRDDVELPATDGTYTVTVAISGEMAEIEVVVMTAPILPDPITAIAVEAEPMSVFVGDDIEVTVTLWDADGEGEASAEMVINLSDGDMGGSFTDADGNAITSVTIAVGGFDASATYSNSTAGDYTLTAMDADEESEVEAGEDKVTVKPIISNLQVNGTAEPAPVKGSDTITVSAVGKLGRANAEVTNTAGDTVVSPEAKGLDGDADDAGNVTYTRAIKLPNLDDGDYTIKVTIAGVSDSITIKVLNDQSAPTLSNASAKPVQNEYAMNGNQVVLSVKVTLNDSGIEIGKVVANTADLDSENPEVELGDANGDGVYDAIFTISTANTNADGEKTVTFTATDVYDTDSDPEPVSITLKNDVTPPVLSDENAMPSPAANGTEITISVSSESGLTVMADASAIGGGMVPLNEPTMAEDGNGNGNGMDANGNGMDANGNVTYTGMATVTDAADGEQMITITATDGSGNAAEATVSVMIDNTGPALTDAMADPAMATNGTMVTISVSTESGATVMADASAIGGDAAVALDESADTAGSYSADVEVADAEDGEQMVMISASDALGNAGESVSVSVTVDNTGPSLSDASADPAEAVNGDMVTISVMGGESGLTVMADASELGADAAVALDESADTAGMYSATVEVNADSGGDKMVSISASDALGNASETVTVMVSVHEVTSADFDPKTASTGDMVTVTAMGTAGLTATFSVFKDAESEPIVNEMPLMESADGGTYMSSFEVVVDVHPTGEYWVSVSVGKASMTAEAALTIDHKAQFTLTIPAGTHAIHIPLDVTHIGGEAAAIDTVGDLYNELGDSVNFIISLINGNPVSYLGDESAGSMADAAIGDDTGLIVVMKSSATLELTGNALGIGGVSTINIDVESNWVGVPLNPTTEPDMISDMLGNGVEAIAVSGAPDGGFHTIFAAGDPGDGPLMGGVGYIIVSSTGDDIAIVGSAWENDGAVSAAPAVAFSGSQTPVLHVSGGLLDEFDMMSRIPELRVTVKNLSTGASLDTVLGTEASKTAYSGTFVEFSRHAAKAGDVLEITAHSPNPFVGVRPVPQIVVSAEEVLTSRISLPDLELYEIPSETELLANYPNPFNPETWIPYRLAKAAEVTLSIYDTNGALVRSIDVGFKPAAVYESRASAIYWDGRNNYGERVASGTYFYHLTAGEDYASTRRMVILK